jgi:hypothetical protein
LAWGSTPFSLKVWLGVNPESTHDFATTENPQQYGCRTYAALVERIAGTAGSKELQPMLKVLQPQFKGSTQAISPAQRFNIVAAQDESVAAPVQRFKRYYSPNGMC